MIIEVTHLELKRKPRPKWHQQFRKSLYAANYARLQTPPDPPSSDTLELMGFLRDTSTQVDLDPDEQPTQLEHRYCSYIPLRKTVQVDDELVNTFGHLRSLRDRGRTQELDKVYAQIRRHIHKCKEANEIELGWQICLERFTCQLDAVQRVQVYHQVLLGGTGALARLHGLLNGRCAEQVFVERVMQGSRYFREEVRMNLAMGVSVELREEINETTLAKTAKMLYCTICLIFDCGKHKLDDLCHDKDYRYISPRNLIHSSQHILHAISLFRHLQSLPRPTATDPSACGEMCYKKMTPQTALILETLKSRLLSPFVEALIKIGVQMFSYQPCLITHLFGRHPLSQPISCSLIFMYFVQEGNLFDLLANKVNPSETELLLREPSADFLRGKQGPRAPKIAKKRKKKKKVNVEKQGPQGVSLCYHSYIGEEMFDTFCSACSCSERGFCRPSCQCSPECPLALRGCACRGKDDCQTSKCPCYQNRTECIPELCQGCFHSERAPQRNLCNNNQILLRKKWAIKVGPSQIEGAGLGAFAAEFIPKNSLVSVYCGELIESEMATIRETVKTDESFYNFGCAEGTIDARYMGNKSRFINHANESEGKANLISVNWFSEGQEYIPLYALRDIHEGEELYFDYDAEGQIAAKHVDIYPFLRKQ